ncbi:MAG: efflux RND transporter periplasmic adaptor subunit [Chitinophagales bacterium]
MKSWIFWGSIILFIGGIIFYNKVLNAPKAQGGMMAMGKGGSQQAMPVSVIIAKAENVESTIDATGTLTALDEVELKPETSGKIVLLNINEGAHVSKGALLLKINDAELQAQLKKLQLQKDVAVRNEDRLKKLLAINGVGQQDYDIALNQLNNIISDIQLLQAQIEKTEIRAPFSGKIGLRNVSNGAVITQGTTVATLVNSDKLRVDFFVPERYAGVVAIGKQVQLEIDGIATPIQAKVIATESKIDLASRNIKVRAEIENTKHLMPGSFAKVKLNIQTKNSILIPSGIVIAEARGKKVMRFENGKATPVAIETGIRTKDAVQVISGITAGDTIISSGIMFLKPNAEVTVSKVE